MQDTERGVMDYRPTRFWETYVTQSDGTVQTREWVSLTKPGMAHMTGLEVRITDKVKAGHDWEAIEPYYEAWKKGQEAPESGTPLGAWPGLTREQAEILKSVGMKSVEDVSTMTEKVMGMVKLPNVRRIKDEAGMFLQAKDVRGVEVKMQNMQDEIAALRAELAEKHSGNDPEPQKRRGRPPRAQEAPVDLDDEEAA